MAYRNLIDWEKYLAEEQEICLLIPAKQPKEKDYWKKSIKKLWITMHISMRTTIPNIVSL